MTKWLTETLRAAVYIRAVDGRRPGRLQSGSRPLDLAMECASYRYAFDRYHTRNEQRPPRLPGNKDSRPRFGRRFLLQRCL